MEETELPKNKFSIYTWLMGAAIILSIGMFLGVNVYTQLPEGICKNNSSANITALNSSYQSGYNKAISDTQNTTLMIGYCAAQQEVYKSGVLAANNTILVIPITTLKEVCFR
jgi:hypothetical protein